MFVSCSVDLPFPFGVAYIRLNSWSLPCMWSMQATPEMTSSSKMHVLQADATIPVTLSTSAGSVVVLFLHLYFWFLSPA